jgi:hypothetical protein
MNYKPVPEEFRKGLKPGDLIKISGNDILYRISYLKYPSEFCNPVDNGVVEYWPEHTIVTNPRMVKLGAIMKQVIKDWWIVITKIFYYFLNW